MKRTALIFDLDGTLVDSLPDLQAALNEALREIGAAPLSCAELRPMVATARRRLSDARWRRGECRRRLAGAAQSFPRAYEAEPALRSRLYPDVAETLAALQAQGIASASAPISRSRDARRTARLRPRGRLRRVLGGDAVAERKPHPGHLLAAITALAPAPPKR